MQHFFSWIIQYGDLVQLLIFTGLLVLAWNIENAAGLLLGYKKWQHAFRNGWFILTNLPGQFVLGILFLKTTAWTTEHHFGLLYMLRAHHSLEIFITGFILLDLGEYIYHIIMHKIKRLWMFHAVHHTDEVLDVSTTFREHPGENFIRLSFTLLWMFLTGAPFWVLMLRQVVQVFSTIFAHINYALPERTDRIIGMVFITPNLHRVHHHHKQPYTDCNYGDVLSIWDRLFCTFRKLPPTDVIIGVDTYTDQSDIGSFRSVFKIPFGKYRLSEQNKAKVIDINKKGADFILNNSLSQEKTLP